MASGDYRGGYRAGYRGQGYVAGYPPRAASGHAPPSAGLAAWYRADAGVTKSGSDVTAWADQSGNGNDLTAPSTSPAFAASSINGKPGITFGSSTPLTRATSPLASGSDRTVVVVCNPAANGAIYTAGGPLVAFKSNLFPTWVGYAASIGGTVYGWSNESVADQIASPPAIQDVPMSIEINTHVGSLPTFAINGTSYVTSDADVVTSDTGLDGFAIGSKVDSSAWPVQFFVGDICEVLVYGRILAGADLTQLRAYIASRYGIA